MRRKDGLRMLVLQELNKRYIYHFLLQILSGDWIDSISSRFVDELPEKYIKKINNYEREEEEFSTLIKTKKMRKICIEAQVG